MSYIYINKNGVVIISVTPGLENNRIEEAVTLNNMTEQNRNNTQSQNYSHAGSYSSLYTICQVGTFLKKTLTY